MKEYSLIIIYVPCPNLEVAETVARHLIDLDLAFCVQIQSPVKSFYMWEGELRTDLETPLIIKTFQSFEERITKELLTLHPYEIPAILRFDGTSLNPAFTQWAATIQK